MKEKIIETLRFFGNLERPLTAAEIWAGAFGRKVMLSEFLPVLKKLQDEKSVAESEGFYFLPEFSPDLRRRKLQDILLYGKRRKFLKRAKIFDYVPFLDFGLAAGSVALGNVRDDSDFDVILACRKGRIFTARFFSVLIFGLLGMRRRNLDHKTAARDKICLNHFVTAASYRLSPPHNLYWLNLYRNLWPVFGDSKMALRFFEANDWAGAAPPLFWPSRTDSAARRVLEVILGAASGDFLEAVLKKIQVKRIERGLRTAAGEAPRLRYDDEELEFHPDTSRIKEMIR